MSGKLRDESLAEPKEGTNTDPITMMQVNVSAKMAMTWTLLGSVQPNTGNAYVLIGSDAKTNAYTGDTSTLDVLPVLCINKNAPTHPGSAIWGPKQTPGGAWRQTWSGGTVALTAPVQGVSLTSRAAADALCSSEFGAGYRIAEFHDGDPNR
ncbi:MAG TPA: hypothetical protein PKA58_33605, partial [Polyangium sp.]|nr:hypothetical protein [Polyangium sp.]